MEQTKLLVASQIDQLFYVESTLLAYATLLASIIRSAFLLSASHEMLSAQFHESYLIGNLLG